MLPTTLSSPKHRGKKKLYSKQKTLSVEEPRTVHQEFFFKPRRKQVDWRLISSVNVDDIIQNTNIQVLQSLIENITFCNMEGDANKTSAPSDPNLIKLFQLSQLIIEFLVHSQNFLLRNQQQQEMDVLTLEEELEKNQSQIEKLKQQLEEKSKEVKGLKKTLFAYEIVSKQPDKTSAGTSYFKCAHCAKAFSSQNYLDSHITRRHSDEHGHDQEKKKQIDSELERVVQMMEKFTANLGQNSDEIKKEESKKLEGLMAQQLEQERLKFEKELQSLKSSMHRELEEERALLKRDREALERMVNENQKNVIGSKVHVGDLEDDDKSDGPQPKKPSTKPPSTRPKKNDSENLKKKIHQEYEKELQTIQNVISDQVGKFKQQMLIENEIHTHDLEKKLKMAANEIERLKSLRMDHEDSADLTSPSHKDRKEIWKKYMVALEQFKNTPNPALPEVKSKYQHPENQIKNEKEIIKLEIDRFLGEQGLSEVNIKKMVSDPTLKSVATGLSNYISSQRAITTSEVLCYEEMRSLIESQVEKAAVSASHFDHYHSSSSISNAPSLPRRSSLKKSSNGMIASQSSTKSVKISENVKIEPSGSVKGLRALKLQIPPDDLDGPSIINTPPSPHSATLGSPNRTATDLASKTTESIKNAFSALASRTLGFSKSKSQATEKFDQTIGFRKFQLKSPTSQSPSPNAPVKYLDIAKSGTAPVEHTDISSISEKESMTDTQSRDEQSTSAGDDITSDIDITELSSAKQKPASSSNPKSDEKMPSVNLQEKEKLQDKESTSDVSFDVSDVSDTDSARNDSGTDKKLLKNDLVDSEESDFDDDFDDQTKKITKLVQSTGAEPLLVSSMKNPDNESAAKTVSSHQSSVKSTKSNDDDVLDFLEEIDASLGDQITTKTKKDIPHIDDIDDFDSL